MTVTGRAQVELSGPPGALTTYRRALLQRAHGKDRVPEKVLRLSGVRPDVEHVRRYVDVCGGRLSDTLPLLYPHMLGFPLQMALLTDADSPFAAMGLVHVTNTATALRPVPLAEPLDLEVEMTAPRPHRKGRTVDLVARACVAGEVVWHSASTYLKRGRGTEEAPGPALEARPELLTRPGAVWRLPGDLGRTYGDVSGDRNPIHLSSVTARLFGFPTAIAHGMWTAARALAALEGRVPDAVRYDVEFRQPVPLPGAVEFADDGGGPTAASIDLVVRSARPGKDGTPKVHLLARVGRP